MACKILKNVRCGSLLREYSPRGNGKSGQTGKLDARQKGTAIAEMCGEMGHKLTQLPCLLTSQSFAEHNRAKIVPKK